MILPMRKQLDLLEKHRVKFGACQVLLDVLAKICPDELVTQLFIGGHVSCDKSFFEDIRAFADVVQLQDGSLIIGSSLRVGTLCGDPVVEGKQVRTFCDFSCARECGDLHESQYIDDFLQFLRCPRPLRRFAWSFKKLRTFYDSCGARNPRLPVRVRER